MKKRRNMTNGHVSTTVMVVGLFLITTYGTLGAQERQFRRDPLRNLGAALKQLGAPELTLEQQDQLLSLAREFREARRAAKPGPAVHEARQAYQEAILSSDNASAQAQADVIANEVTATMRSSLENEANFKIGVLNVLSEDQTGLLLEHVGTSGLFRLLGSQGQRRRHGPEVRPEGQHRRRGPEVVE